MGCSGPNTSSNIRNFKFAIGIDGCEHAETGFLETLNQKFNPGNKLHLIHIYHSSKFIDMTLEELPKHLLPNYEKALSKNLQKSNYDIIKREKENIETSDLESVVEIATEKNSDLLVIGAVGHKSVKNSRNFRKDLSYIIQNYKIPTLVIKQFIPT